MNIFIWQEEWHIRYSVFHMQEYVQEVAELCQVFESEFIWFLIRAHFD